jgi:hypothetical protein
MKKIYVFYILLVVIPPFCFSQELGQGQEKLTPEHGMIMDNISKCIRYLERPLPSDFEWSYTDTLNCDIYISNSTEIILVTRKNEETVIEAQFGDLFSTLRDASYYHATIIETLELLKLRYYATLDKMLNCDVYTNNGLIVMVFPPGRGRTSDSTFIVHVWITDIFEFGRYTSAKKL